MQRWATGTHQTPTGHGHRAGLHRRGHESRTRSVLPAFLQELGSRPQNSQPSMGRDPKMGNPCPKPGSALSQLWLGTQHSEKIASVVSRGF